MTGAPRYTGHLRTDVPVQGEGWKVTVNEAEERVLVLEDPSYSTMLGAGGIVPGREKDKASLA